MCYQEVDATTRGAQGGVGIVERDRMDGWSVDSTRFHRPNVVNCEIVSGGKWTPLIG